MMTLARVVCDYGHAVQRDLLCHRYRWADFGKPTHELLTFDEFTSFVLGATGDSPLALAVNEGWTLTDHLLATRLEQADGLVHLTGLHHRRGYEPAPAAEQCDGGGVINQTPEQPESQEGAEQIQAAVAIGGRFTTFDHPDDFEAKLAEFKARRLQAQEAANGG